jgi:hypothetical protein
MFRVLLNNRVFQSLSMSKELEISSSLPLQILINCSIWYAPVYALGMGIAVVTKVLLMSNHRSIILIAHSFIKS